MNKSYLVILGLLLFVGCNQTEENKEDAIKENNKLESEKVDVDNEEMSAVDVIIKRVYNKYGSEKVNESNIFFEFRDTEYAYIHGEEGLKRSRKFTNDAGENVSDVWISNELSRFVDGEKVEITEKKEDAYINSINSVFYFGFLPKALKDPAVNAELLDQVEINGKEYHKIKVTFDEEGGGEDFHDIFLYWIGVGDDAMDYVAYQYFTEGGGIRFRAAEQTKTVNGITFTDYLNYGPKEEMMDNYINVDEVFENDGLKLVSEIRFENIRVE